MLSKKYTDEGQKYYVNAITGRTEQLGKGNPLKKPANPTISRAMNPAPKLQYRTGKTEIEALKDQFSAYVGSFKAGFRALQVSSKDFDKNKFILDCKRIGFSPYPILKQYSK